MNWEKDKNYGPNYAFSCKTTRDDRKIWVRIEPICEYDEATHSFEINKYKIIITNNTGISSTADTLDEATQKAGEMLNSYCERIDRETVQQDELSKRKSEAYARIRAKLSPEEAIILGI